MYAKTNDPDFVRDEASGALINTNVSAYKLYKQQRSSQSYIKSLDSEVNDLRSEVDELKQIIKDILREKHGNSNF